MKKKYKKSSALRTVVASYAADAYATATSVKTRLLAWFWAAVPAAASDAAAAAKTAAAAAYAWRR